MKHTPKGARWTWAGRRARRARAIEVERRARVAKLQSYSWWPELARYIHPRFNRYGVKVGYSQLQGLAPVEGQPGLFRDLSVGHVINIRDWKESDKYDTVVISGARNDYPKDGEIVFFQDIY